MPTRDRINPDVPTRHKLGQRWSTVDTLLLLMLIGLLTVVIPHFVQAVSGGAA